MAGVMSPPIHTEWTPSELNLASIDLTNGTDSPWDSPVIDLSPYNAFTAIFTVDNTNGSVGSARYELRICDKFGAQFTGFVLINSIGLASDRNEICSWSKGLAATKSGNGTLGSELSVLSGALHKVVFRVTLLTPSDATTGCTGNFHFFASGS